MTYEEAQEYTKTISKTGSILGLASIRNLMQELGDVQDKLPVIHIAGTNGKGSTGAFLSGALIQAGYRVGRYTSPAVFSPFEVWQINGTDISIEDYTSTLSQVKNACDIMVSKGMPQPTVFEVETALAFLYFYRQKCDYVLLETGMGGSTDATNIIKKPLCSVLTSISMDHMPFLGDSITEIAEAKAGIIKAGCPAVTILQEPKVMQVIHKAVEAAGTKLWTADFHMLTNVEKTPEEISYDAPKTGRVRIRMTGECQLENSYLALTVLKEVLHIGTWDILSGLYRAVWRGRFEVLKNEPFFIIDGAHNEDAAVKLRKTLQNYFTNRRITYIIGVLADKEHDKMLREMLPLAWRIYTVTPHHPRALDGKLLAEEARKYHKAVEYCTSVESAAAHALSVSGPDDVIVAFGSLSYLKEVREAADRKETVKLE